MRSHLGRRRRGGQQSDHTGRSFQRRLRGFLFEVASTPPVSGGEFACPANSFTPLCKTLGTFGRFRAGTFSRNIGPMSDSTTLDPSKVQPIQAVTRRVYQALAEREETIRRL